MKGSKIIGWGLIGCGEMANEVVAPAVKRSCFGKLIAF